MATSLALPDAKVDQAGGRRPAFRHQRSIVLAIPRFVEVELLVEFLLPNERQQVDAPTQQRPALFVHGVGGGKLPVVVVVAVHGQRDSQVTHLRPLPVIWGIGRWRQHLWTVWLNFLRVDSDGNDTASRESCARLFLGNMRIMGYLLNVAMWRVYAANSADCSRLCLLCAWPKSAIIGIWTASGRQSRQGKPTVNILLATSEAVPFAKTGGLADVCGALPVELARLGHQAAVILPAYRQTRYCGQPIEPLGIDFIVPIGSKMVTGHLLRSTMPGGKVPVYLVEQDQYFDRDQLYSVDGKDYIDNCERFVFFSRAVLEAIRLLDLHVDVLHANDWQTGLMPAYLKIEYRGIPRYQRIASLLTIHNISYQGQFWHWDMLLTGLGLEVFQLAADGVPRQSEPAEDGHGVRRLDQHGQPALRAGDSEQPAWVAGWKACCNIAATCSRAFSTASTRTSGIRPPIRTCRRITTSTPSTRASRSARRRCRRNWACRANRPRRWWASSAG